MVLLIPLNRCHLNLEDYRQIGARVVNFYFYSLFFSFHIKYFNKPTSNENMSGLEDVFKTGDVIETGKRRINSEQEKV